jgi:hypothetical protein
MRMRGVPEIPVTGLSINTAPTGVGQNSNDPGGGSD